MMQVARAAFQVQVNPLRQATDPMSHTLAYDDTNPGSGSSSPTNPMIDPIAIPGGVTGGYHQLIHAFV
jgi:hypothetical protein